MQLIGLLAALVGLILQVNSNDNLSFCIFLHQSDATHNAVGRPGWDVSNWEREALQTQTACLRSECAQHHINIISMTSINITLQDAVSRVVPSLSLV